MAGTSEGTSADGPKPKDPFKLKEITELFKRGGPPDQVLTELLATQCRTAKSDAAVVMRAGEEGQLKILAVYPAPPVNGAPMAWVARAEKPIRKVMSTGESVIFQEATASKRGAGPKRYLIIIPIQNETAVRAAAAFSIETQHPHELLVSRAFLETTPLLLDHYALRLTLKERHETMNRLGRVLEVLFVVNRTSRFLSAAMALCNEMATQLACSRVSLGYLNGRYVKVQAISNTDTFSREMRLVQAIEAAMEECLDQDVEVVYPATDTVMVVSRATANLSKNHGHTSVLSLPIREGDEVSAVLTLERPPERPFDKREEVEAVRLVCDLCAPRLSGLRQSDRWFGARLASWSRQQMGLLLGHEHTWIKVGVCLVFLMGMFLTTAKGDYRIEAAFTLEPREQQVVVAPFASYLKSVLVEPGDKAKGGQTILGALETSELRLQLAARKAEQLGYQKQMTASMRDRKTAEAQISRAQSDKLAAEIRLIERKIEQATLVAPISGWVVSEDLKRQIGAPVETGKILFEIARIDSLRAELYVPESSITRIATGQTGELASVGHPDQKIPFVIERVNPIAEVINGQNVFSVRAHMDEHLEWMRPGMEGSARISAGTKSYLWIGSHRLVNWLRMKLWI